MHGRDEMLHSVLWLLCARWLQYRLLDPAKIRIRQYLRLRRMDLERWGQKVSLRSLRLLRTENPVVLERRGWVWVWDLLWEISFEEHLRTCRTPIQTVSELEGLRTGIRDDVM
jgi:hypothetical protein